MMTTHTSRRLLASVVMFCSLFIASQSFAAVDMFLKLVSKDGSSYTAKIDSKGKFSFGEIPPGTYELRLVCPSGYCADNKGTSISVDSWSWGASNPGTAMTTSTVTTARETGSGMATGRRVATGDVDGDGFTAATAAVTKPITCPASPKLDGDESYIVLCKVVSVPGVCSPTGTAVAINEKGLPGDKRPVKATK